jgi:hypothetical protein
VDADGVADAVRIDKVTIPLDGTATGAQQLIEAASRGTIADAAVTGGSLELILERIFSDVSSS